jgi:hypothetical protein
MDWIYDLMLDFTDGYKTRLTLWDPDDFKYKSITTGPNLGRKLPFDSNAI